MTLSVDGKIIPLPKIAKFVTFWVPIVFLVKYFKMESNEQFARVAMWACANKVFEILR